MFIRFGKGGEKIVTESMGRNPLVPKSFGVANSTVTICTTGVLLQHALEAQEILSLKNISVTVLHFPYLNVLGISNFFENISNSEIVIVAEEHIPRGGLFTQLLHEFYQNHLSLEKFIHLSLPASYSHNYGSQIDHFVSNLLTGRAMADLAIERLTSR
jgi:transketolase